MSVETTARQNQGTDSQASELLQRVMTSFDRDEKNLKGSEAFLKVSLEKAEARCEKLEGKYEKLEEKYERVLEENNRLKDDNRDLRAKLAIMEAQSGGTGASPSGDRYAGIFSQALRM
jgi:chromosome segregation ATPase